MNEQLQKLYEQSFVTDTYVNVGPDGAKLGIKFDPEKFAELLVRECLDQCYNRGMNDELYAGQLKAAAYIEEHFGVEE